MPEPSLEKWFNKTTHTYKPAGYIYKAHFECHDILMLGKSPLKWRHRPDMTIVVDWDVKINSNKQTIQLMF